MTGTRTKRYRTVTMTAPQGETLGNVSLKGSEKIRREIMFITEKGDICCTILIRENVDRANERKVKNEEKKAKKEKAKQEDQQMF